MLNLSVVKVYSYEFISVLLVVWREGDRSTLKRKRKPTTCEARATGNCFVLASSTMGSRVPTKGGRQKLMERAIAAEAGWYDGIERTRRDVRGHSRSSRTR